MWVSRAFSLRQAAEREGTAADMGMTTIGGKNASVMTRGEQRELEIFAPGGLVWQPLAGDTVLVVKGGVGCQEQCVVAAETAGSAPKDMAPGELFPGLTVEGGFVTVDRNMATNLPGVFAAGDCTGGPLQVSKAAGEGLIAGQSAAAYVAGLLRKQK